VSAILLDVVSARFGETVIAAFTVSSRITASANLIMIGWGQGFQPICAMNYGAKQYDRVKRAMRLTIIVGTVFLIAAAGLLACFAVPLTTMLTKDPDVIKLGAKILRLQCITIPLLAVYAVSSMYMQNVGRYFWALMISISRQGIFYLPALFLLASIFGQTGLFLTQPAAEVCSFLFWYMVLLLYWQR